MLAKNHDNTDLPESTGPRLSLEAIDALAPEVLRPGYERSDLKAGIVHIGVGNFHRAHQAFYLDRLFDLGEDHEWAIVGAGLTASDGARREQLVSQDWLTTVVELEPSEMNARVIGSMIDFLPPDPAALVEQLARPEIRIVTLTITEGGYFIDPETSQFDVGHPDIIKDSRNFEAPKSVFGVLLRALWLRKKAGLQPFTILSCDNLMGNGGVTHEALIAMAGRIAEVDKDWVANSIACPNSMVDCITPATSHKERDFVASTFDFVDAAPVFCEPFRQWVIEDHFPSGRPALEKVGVQFTDDVGPFEELKLSLLNAGHAAIAYPAALLGIGYAHEAMADDDVFQWFEALLTREVVPNLNPAGTTSPKDYLSTVTQRFHNPAIKDSISRLCEDGENRQPKFIFPSIRRAIIKGTPIDGLALETALWCRFLAEFPDAGNPAAQAAHFSKSRPTAFLQESGLFGDLSQSDRFVEAFSRQITSVWENGVRASLRAFVEQG